MAEKKPSKIKASFTRGITAINVRTSSSLEKSKLKTHMDSLETEIEKDYYAIGELAYKLWLKTETNEAGLVQLFESVKAKYATIAELTAQLDSIDQRDNEILGKTKKAPNLTCPKCGAVYESPVKFCRSCGTKMPE